MENPSLQRHFHGRPSVSNTDKHFKISPWSPSPLKTPCTYVRACARARVRTGHWEAASPLSVFQFPGVLRARQMGGGDARWRQPRIPAPASRCSTARLGEWRGGQGWSGLGCPELAVRLVSRSRPNGSDILGLTEGELFVRPGGVWRNGEPGPKH